MGAACNLFVAPPRQKIYNINKIRKDMTNEEQKTIDKIKSMTQVEMASLWRFAPAGHPYFDKTKPYWEVFDKRFKELGGFTPEISKMLS